MVQQDVETSEQGSYSLRKPKSKNLRTESFDEAGRRLIKFNIIPIKKKFNCKKNGKRKKKMKKQTDVGTTNYNINNNYVLKVKIPRWLSWYLKCLCFFIYRKKILSCFMIFVLPKRMTFLCINFISNLQRCLKHKNKKRPHRLVNNM